jgi:hypothetical protein
MKAQLDAYNREIADLEANGQGGGLDLSHPKPTRDGFLDNKRKLILCEGRVEKIKIKLTDPKCDRKAVMAQKEEAEFEANNMRGIVARQITTGIWKDASSKYLGRIRERRQLENDIHIATGERFPDRSDEYLKELTFDRVYKNVVAYENQ